MSSKRPKEAYGKKLIYRYSAPVIFTLFFSLVALAAFVLTFFFPYIHGEVDLNGQHFLMFAVDLFRRRETYEVYYYLNDFANTIFDGAEWAFTVLKISAYVLLVALLIMAIFAFILAIGCIVLLFSGRLKAWKLPYRCITGMFISGFFFYGAIIAINIYVALIKKVAYYDSLYTYIFLGTLFVTSIINHIIYSKAFKNHVYIKNTRTLNQYIEEYERENVVVDTTGPEEVLIEEAPKVVMMPMEDQTEKNSSSDNRKKLPRGLKHIGGHAFSQNTVLEEADIPLGIEVLGAGAFANCVNLKIVHIPESVKKIEYNCFFNCIRLERITYGGSREMWRRIKRGSNWLTAAGTKFVVCRDGALAVDPEK